MGPPLFQVSYPDTEILLPNLNVSTINIKITNEFVTVNASNGNYTQLGSENIGVSSGPELARLDVDALHLNNATNTLTVEATNIYFASVGDNVSVALGSVDGITLTSGPFQPTSILDGSNASGTSGQVLSAGAGGNLSWITTTSGFVGTANSNLSMSTYNVNFANASGAVSIINAGGINLSDTTTVSSFLAVDGIGVMDIAPGVVTSTTMYPNRVVTGNSDASTESRITSDGQVIVNYAQPETSMMNVSGIEFTTAVGTARISTIDGITLSTGSFQPTSILDGSNASGTSGQVLSAGAGGALSWITPASGADPTSDLNMSTYNLSWNGGLKLTDDGSGNLSINTLVDATSGRSFAQKYLPVNVNISGVPTLAYLQIFI
jgi:hypothetical protein